MTTYLIASIPSSALTISVILPNNSQTQAVPGNAGRAFPWERVSQGNKMLSPLTQWLPGSLGCYVLSDTGAMQVSSIRAN